MVITNPLLGAAEYGFIKSLTVNYIAVPPAYVLEITLVAVRVRVESYE